MERAIEPATIPDEMDDELDREIDWHRYLHADPNIIGGKPVVKGTRLGAEFLLRLFAAGWTHEQVFECYPHLRPEALRAVFAFAADVVGEELWTHFPPDQRAK
jgi:uncharacterized protein (DUF433 family)